MARIEFNQIGYDAEGNPQFGISWLAALAAFKEFVPPIADAHNTIAFGDAEAVRFNLEHLGLLDHQGTVTSLGLRVLGSLTLRQLATLLRNEDKGDPQT